MSADGQSTTATPTSAEWTTAAALALRPTQMPPIAQALADQRARYEALADELEAEALRMNPSSLSAAARSVAAERIRKVADR